MSINRSQSVFFTRLLNLRARNKEIKIKITNLINFINLKCNENNILIRLFLSLFLNNFVKRLIIFNPKRRA